VSTNRPAPTVKPIWAMLRTLLPTRANIVMPKTIPAVVTTFNEDELLSGALRAGAAGFVLKDSSAEELIRAVRAVARGEGYLDPGVTSRVLHTYRRAGGGRPAGSLTELTVRELDVLTLIGAGRSNNEIAEDLFISSVTVKSHIGRIFQKLELRDRAAAIVYAYDHGIVAPR
jgi:DNA-binding NarL/FixJ family response regulator